MRQRTVEALSPNRATQCPSPRGALSLPTSSGCPVPHHDGIASSGVVGASSCPVGHGNARAAAAGDDVSSAPSLSSTLSRLNPLNYMFRDLPQTPAPGQDVPLPTSRDASSIPRGDGSGANWEYPSPQGLRRHRRLGRRGHGRCAQLPQRGRLG